MSKFEVGQSVEVSDSQGGNYKAWRIAAINGNHVDIGADSAANPGTTFVPQRMKNRPISELVEVYQAGKPNRIIWNRE